MMHPKIFFFKMNGSGDYAHRISHLSFFEKYLTTQVIIPRSLCIYQKISCENIPKIRLKKFAELQIESHSPFNKSGAFSLIQGKWLHLWVWEKNIEEKIRKNISNNENYHIYPSSLAFKPKEDGVHVIDYSGCSGIEIQLWKNKLLVDSLFFDDYPTQVEWEVILKDSIDLVSQGWPNNIPEKASTLNKESTFIWGKNITPRSEAQLSINWPKIANSALVLSSIYIASWGGWTYAQKNGYKNIVNDGIAMQEANLALLEPINETRIKVKDLTQWLDNADKLTSSPSFGEIISYLKNNFPRQGLVVRELEISPPTVQATFTPLTAISPSLTSILNQLSESDFFYDARFIDVSSGNGFKFSWRIRTEKEITSQGEEK